LFENLGFVISRRTVSRDEAIEKLAEILAKHHPNIWVGCMCMYETPASKADIDATPTLKVPWETHVAEISFQYAKGF
jgi:hypothetical protein